MTELIPTAFWLLFWLFTGILLHELAHAIAARYLGLRVAFCGVGYGLPKLTFGYQRTRYFFGVLPLNGLTLLVVDGLRGPTKSYIKAIAAGPLTNLALCLLGLLLDVTGALPHTVAMPLWVSSALLSINLIPVTFGPRGRKLQSDGMLMLQFWRGTDHQVFHAGTRLESYNFLRDLSKDVDSPLGQITSLLTLASDYLSVGAQAHAHASLQQALALQDDAPPEANLPLLTRITQDYLGLTDLDPAEVDELSRPTFRLMQAERRIRQEKFDLARQTLKELEADPETEPWIRTQSEAMRLTLDPPAAVDLASQTRALIRRRGPEALTLDYRLTLLSFTCARLLEQDEAATDLGHFLKHLTRGTRQALRCMSEPQIQETYLAQLFPPELADYRPDAPPSSSDDEDDEG